MFISVVSPVGVPAVPDTPYKRSIPGSGFSGRLGLMANSQPGSHDFVWSLAEALGPMLPGATLSCSDKGLSPAGSSMVMDDDELREAVISLDAAVLAYGHCGGCTSATVRDAVSLARRGLPVVVLVVPRFVEQAKLVARASGMSRVPVHVLPGPMTQLSVEGRAAAACEASPRVFELLTGTRSRP